MRFRSATRPRLFLIATAVAALALTGCAAPAAEAMPTGSAGDAVSGADPAGGVAATLAALETIPVKGRAPKTSYSRDLFGPAWTDDVTVAGGRNGCDTRNDILARDLVDTTVKPGTGNCVVLTGTLHDPYSGKSIAFTRGSGTSSAVQIDHVESVDVTVEARDSARLLRERHADDTVRSASRVPQ